MKDFIRATACSGTIEHLRLPTNAGAPLHRLRTGNSRSLGLIATDAPPIAHTMPNIHTSPDEQNPQELRIATSGWRCAVPLVGNLHRKPFVPAALWADVRTPIEFAVARAQASFVTSNVCTGDRRLSENRAGAIRTGKSQNSACL